MTEYTVKIPTESIITRTIVEQVTLRDQFAMAALTSMLAPVQDITGSTPDLAAELSYRFADAMLKARKEKK